MQNPLVRRFGMATSATNRSLTAARDLRQLGVGTLRFGRAAGVQQQREYHSHQRSPLIDLGVAEEEVEEWNCKKAPDSLCFVNADKMPARSIEELQHETLAILGGTPAHAEDRPTPMM